MARSSSPPSGELRLEPLARPIEVTMRWAPCSLWLVPDAAALARLVADGVSRGRVWCVEELLALHGLPPAEARRRALARLDGDGTFPVERDPSA